VPQATPIARLTEEIVQGPEEHPRLGRAVVVRPTIETVRANRYPTQAVVVTAVARKLIELSRAGDKIQALVVVRGQETPTRHPEFHEISENMRQLLDKHFPKAGMHLITEATTLDTPALRHALTFYDRTFLRLDAGTQKTWAALTGSPPKEFKSIVESMGGLGNERLIVETRFVRGEVDNSSDTEVKAWIRHLTEIRPSGVQISTLPKAKGKKEVPITKTRMNQIAELVTSKTGIPVEVVPG
jgi:wyosine [tRNA(Phe)-imidazoG37] synthetase (radical SAM superfamily)